MLNPLLRTKACEIYKNILKITEDASLFKYHRQFSEIHIPSIDAPTEKWVIFAKDISHFFQVQFIDKGYGFTEEEILQVDQYIYTAKLLYDCLKVAYVSDRAAIKDRLLRPPKN